MKAVIFFSVFYLTVPCITTSDHCGYPSNAFALIVNNQCPVANPECIIDTPFDFLANTKFHCVTASVIVNNSVMILSPSDLLDLVSRDSENKGLPICMLTAFYAVDCFFSSLMIPHLNALPRMYEKLRIVAADATGYSKLNMRYGISGTPTVILWLDGVALARMDQAPFSLSAFRDFLERWTDLEPVYNVEVSEADYDGPLKSKYDPNERSWRSWISWVVLILSLTYFFLISESGQQFRMKLYNRYN